MNKQLITQGVLYFLSTPGREEDHKGWTINDIEKFLQENKVKDYCEDDSYAKEAIKTLLNLLVDQNLIQERHFSNGRVDFSLKDKGTFTIDPLLSQLKINWKIPTNYEDNYFR